ncbi:hypothetical protein TanjilG_00307 [Lupinus angustifolius]|uniref:Uncharacterized protein n=1 Tax=Lupinus angustifolius TaxID=3871 RepID=A0A394D4N3_LUPAN|nr:hypothetical protein TanjilG_00307 [Lupinus angustifolius]
MTLGGCGLAQKSGPKPKGLLPTELGQQHKFYTHLQVVQDFPNHVQLLEMEIDPKAELVVVMVAMALRMVVDVTLVMMNAWVMVVPLVIMTIVMFVNVIVVMDELANVTQPSAIHEM